MKPADWAWLAIAGGVLAYEAQASRNRHDWELLSEACDRYRQRHPVITNTTICYLALHLMRVLPGRVDPLHQLAARWPR